MSDERAPASTSGAFHQLSGEGVPLSVPVTADPTAAPWSTNTLLAENEALRAQVTNALAREAGLRAERVSIRAYLWLFVTWFGGQIEHEKSCPQDDTCACEMATAINRLLSDPQTLTLEEAIRGLIAEATTAARWHQVTSHAELSDVAASASHALAHPALAPFKETPS